MDIVFPRVAGLDVHKKFITACLLTNDVAGRVHKEVRTFGTMTADIATLRAWLKASACTEVAMESTGVFWQPIYNLLEGQFHIWVVNPQHIKRVPGRKTDVKDSEWLAQLLQHGLLQASFIPDQAQRDLRDLVRMRQSVVEERSRIVNRIQKVLEDANLKLSAVVKDLQGVSAQAILHALLASERDPQVLAALARGRLREKRGELEQALAGRRREQHSFLLTRLLGHLEFLDAELEALAARMEQQLDQIPGARAVIARLDTIPGVSTQTALLIVAEIGADLSRFPSAGHLTAWAGLAPGNNQTGGQARPARTRKGNAYLRRGLVQAAQAAARTKKTYLRALYYRRSAAAARVGRGSAHGRRELSGERIRTAPL